MRRSVHALFGSLLFSLLLAGCGGESTGPGGGTVTQVPNSVTLQSDAGDWIGQGASYSYSQTNAVLTASVSGGHLTFGVSGDQKWTGNFVLPSATRLAAGTYANATRYPFNGAAAGLDWSGEGRGCNILTGTITIDSVTYTGAALTAIDLRFEQHCEAGSSALRGSIHWRADDKSAPPGPQVPIPTTLWSPPASLLPASGNYIYLQSEPGDFIGLGAITTTTAGVAVSSNGGGHLTVSGGGWFGDFQAMSSAIRLEQGYYPSLQRYPFHNPARGGMSWSGNGRGCNTLTGWFVIDRITYNGTVMTGVDLRFEQHCDGGTPALRGVVHWNG